jgi:hypothetical protein
MHARVILSRLSRAMSLVPYTEQRVTDRNHGMVRTRQQSPLRLREPDRSYLAERTSQPTQRVAYNQRSPSCSQQRYDRGVSSKQNLTQHRHHSRTAHDGQTPHRDEHDGAEHIRRTRTSKMQTSIPMRIRNSTIFVGILEPDVHGVLHRCERAPQVAFTRSRHRRRRRASIDSYNDSYGMKQVTLRREVCHQQEAVVRADTSHIRAREVMSICSHTGEQHEEERLYHLQPEEFGAFDHQWECVRARLDPRRRMLDRPQHAHAIAA